MRRPSIKLRREMARALGEADFFGGIERDVELGEDVKRGMESRFGAALFAALEEIERACFAGMAATSPLNIFRQYQLRAELMTAQYIKAKLSGYVVNADTLMQNMEHLNGEDND